MWVKWAKCSQNMLAKKQWMNFYIRHPVRAAARARTQPMNLASPMTCVFFPYLQQRWWAASKPLIPHRVWVRAKWEDTFTHPHSSDPSARGKVSPRSEALASSHVQKKEKEPEGKREAAVANLNHRYQFQSLLLGGTTDKSIITLNQSDSGDLWMS